MFILQTFGIASAESFSIWPFWVSVCSPLQAPPCRVFLIALLSWQSEASFVCRASCIWFLLGLLATSSAAFLWFVRLMNSCRVLYRCMVIPPTLGIASAEGFSIWPMGFRLLFTSDTSMSGSFDCSSIVAVWNLCGLTGFSASITRCLYIFWWCVAVILRPYTCACLLLYRGRFWRLPQSLAPMVNVSTHERLAWYVRGSGMDLPRGGLAT
jgi:hypothetical protein